MDDQPEQTIRQWIEAKTGGHVIEMERQGRWRPAWFVEVTNNGGAAASVRAGSACLHDHLPYDLEREFHIHRLLEDGGVKVPHLQGYLPDVPAIVMDKVPGRHDLRNADSEEARQSVRRQLVHEMVKMHNLDTEPFRKAGLRYPNTPRETTLSFFDDVVELYRQRKRIPNPRLEFLAAWVTCHVPPATTEPRYTACDSGQFIYDGATLTAMVDFELSVLGDPMQDLATLRRRTNYEPLGDIPSLFRMYEEEAGTKIDLDAVRFQTVISSSAAAISGMMWMTRFLSAPGDDGDYVQYSSWVANSTKQGFEGIAEVTGYPLPELDDVAPITTLAHDALFAMKATVDSLDDTIPFRAYQKNTLRDALAYLDRVSAYDTAFTTAYLAGAAAILGTAPRDVADADRMLDAYVQQAGAEDDERLFALLATNATWRCFLLAIPGSTYLDGLTTRLAPL